VEIGQLRIVNHLCGTEAGDQLLREIGELLGRPLSGNDLLARMGDSSFGLLIHGHNGAAAAARAEEFMALLTAHHFRWEQRSFSPGVNLGLAPLDGASAQVDLLLMRADAACMAAKERGPNLMQIYAEHDASLEAQSQLMDWAGRFDSLFAEQALFVRCQRIAPLDPTRNLRPHYEALLGIRGEQGQVLPPSEFILAAERWKRISEIDRWQLKSVLDWACRHREQLERVGGFSINLSGQSLNSESFLDYVHEQLAAATVPTARITFEITETSAIEDFSHAERFMRQIARYGCKFSLDDFGSGFASYSYLKNLKVHYLKIDGSFVRDIDRSATDFALVKSMNEIGHSLGLLTIAEFVENQAILDKLREIGVDYVQGYAIHRAEPLESLL
jgi:diguanylate cyclase (GGDEF)-like protein